MEKQLSSDLIACVVWGSNPTPDNLPLNPLNLALFVSHLSSSEMLYGTLMWVVLIDRHK
jgi:hypothetical protein